MPAYVYFNDIRMFIWYNTYLCHKAAPGSTLELYNQTSFADHLLQIEEVKQERMTEIWDTIIDVHTFLVEISFSQSIPVETEMLLLHQGWGASCGMASGNTLSLQTSPSAAKQPVDDSGILLDQKCLPKKFRWEKRFVQWKPITYLFFWMNPVLVSVFFLQ